MRISLASVSNGHKACETHINIRLRRQTTLHEALVERREPLLLVLAVVQHDNVSLLHSLVVFFLAVVVMVINIIYFNINIPSSLLFYLIIVVFTHYNSFIIHPLHYYLSFCRLYLLLLRAMNYLLYSLYTVSITLREASRITIATTSVSRPPNGANRLRMVTLSLRQMQTRKVYFILHLCYATS